jgi:hypothetical protein
VSMRSRTDNPPAKRGGGNGPAPSVAGTAAGALTLPTEKRPPSFDLAHAKVLLYGPPKIGKTTLVAKLDPDATLFLATEQGTGGVEAYVLPIPDWDAFLGALTALKNATDGRFTTFAVDTVDLLALMCRDHVMRQMGVDHPSDLDYGKGWDAVSTEFRLRIAALSALGGVWFISHAEEREVKPRGRPAHTLWQPKMVKSAREFLQGFVDFIFFADFDHDENGAERRVLRTRASDHYNAGSRTPAPLPDPLPLEAHAVAAALVGASLESDQGASK